jgi:hypothetical protein
VNVAMHLVSVARNHEAHNHETQNHAVRNHGATNLGAQSLVVAIEIALLAEGSGSEETAAGALNVKRLPKNPQLAKQAGKVAEKQVERRPAGTQAAKPEEMRDETQRETPVGVRNVHVEKPRPLPRDVRKKFGKSELHVKKDVGDPKEPLGSQKKRLGGNDRRKPSERRLLPESHPSFRKFRPGKKQSDCYRSSIRQRSKIDGLMLAEADAVDVLHAEDNVGSAAGMSAVRRDRSC